MTEAFEPVAGTDPEPAAELATRDPDLLVAIAQPLRMRLLIEVMRRPMTAAQLAEALQVPLTRLYYHLNLLEGHGAIKVVATRPVRGIEEKRYRATAYSFQLDRDLLTPGNEAFAKVTKALFDSARAEFQVAGEQAGQDDDRMVLVRTVLEFAPDRRKEFTERLRALVEEYTLDRHGGPDVERYGLLVAAYPMVEPS